MKLPEYSLKEPVRVIVSNNMDDVEYPPGTLVFPFWNETLLPEHRLEELKDAQRTSISGPLVMCIIGQDWVPVAAKKIRKN